MVRRKRPESEMTKNKEKNKMAKQKLTAEPEKFPFGKEVKDLLSKMRSIPDGAKVKEVFLWELVRNATKALIRVRLESLVDKERFGDPPEQFIHIAPDKTNHTLSVIDSGIGMTKDDLCSKLGAIGSITRLNKHMRTIHKYSTPPDADVDLSCIYSEDCCQVGLGFYSAYMVAHKIVITTKQKGGDRYVWEFDANVNGGSFTIDARDTSGDNFEWGTKVTLHLKEGHREYLEERKLQDLVNKYPKVMCPHPISILDENKNPIEKQIVVDEDDKEKEEEQWKLLKEQYEGVRKLFVKLIGDKVKNVVEVVISDRVFDLPCSLSVNTLTLEINPRHRDMEKIRKEFVAYPEGEELKDMILLRFHCCLSNIMIYDRRHATMFYENAKRSLLLGENC